jgi:hypothetical protein
MAGFEIRHFDEPLPVDRVIFAIDPVDSFTGGTVRGPVEAEIKALGVRARRNLSGLLVFVNLDERPSYDVQIGAKAAGFFDVAIPVPRPADDASDDQRLRRIELHPLPTARFTHETPSSAALCCAKARPSRTSGSKPWKRAWSRRRCSAAEAIRAALLSCRCG